MKTRSASAQKISWSEAGFAVYLTAYVIGLIYFAARFSKQRYEGGGAD
jgi:hypothetical protein